MRGSSIETRSLAATTLGTRQRTTMLDRAPRILLVDDEQSIQTLLSYPLRKDGYEVVQAVDGREALARFGESTFDLVVLDVMMPRLDGLEVCRRLRARSSVPIIMLTAKAEEIDKVLGLELGADDYITKPFSLREFRSRVKAALRRGGMARRGSSGDAEDLDAIVRQAADASGARVSLIGIDRTGRATQLQVRSDSTAEVEITDLRFTVAAEAARTERVERGTEEGTRGRVAEP